MVGTRMFNRPARKAAVRRAFLLHGAGRLTGPGTVAWDVSSGAGGYAEAFIVDLPAGSGTVSLNARAGTLIENVIRLLY